jgi:hypothetical protein
VVRSEAFRNSVDIVYRDVCRTGIAPPVKHSKIPLFQYDQKFSEVLGELISWLARLQINALASHIPNVPTSHAEGNEFYEKYISSYGIEYHL